MSSWFLSNLGDQAIVVQLGETIDEATFCRVYSLTRKLEQSPPPGMIEWVPAFTTVTIYYDPLRTTPDELSAAIEAALAQAPEQAAVNRRMVEIPVCYGGDFGEDLEFVAQHHRISTEEVIALHTGGEYLTYMIGFTPGFPYLGGLPPRIATPRRETPRLKVPAGSVGIAGEQTGVYPLATPGGWQLIGRTPLALFRPERDPPTLLQAGDLVRFRAISPAEFHHLREVQG